MLFSKEWLQTYFEDTLPSDEDLTEAFTTHAFEVEGLETVGGGSVFDLDTLPDRNHYALCHKGIAYEISAIFNKKMVDEFDPAYEYQKSTRTIDVKVDDPKGCNRYMAKVIENVSIGATPEIIKNRLEKVGQKSINALVDFANYVMLDVNQPMHVFDADKVEGSIVVRKATDGEKMTTIDGKELELTPFMLVVSDDQGPLALAGIKGGKRAEVTEDTKNIIIESANFNGATVRRTSAALALRTDASKRFENVISSELASEGMERLTKHIVDYSEDAKCGDLVDSYQLPEVPRVITMDLDRINTILGTDMPHQKIIAVLKRLGIECAEEGSEATLAIPHPRLDLNIAEDIAEEAGRILGYDDMATNPLSEAVQKPKINKNYYWAEKIKDVLIKGGFSEIITYTLGQKGDLEVEKPQASDKKLLRDELSTGVAQALTLNSHNTDLLGVDVLKIFELGGVFPETGEYRALALGVYLPKKIKGTNAKQIITDIFGKISDAVDVELSFEVRQTETGSIAEINLDNYIEKLTAPENYDDLEVKQSDVGYKKISPFPHVSRDIAVFVPSQVDKDELKEIFQEEGTELLQLVRLFDVFEKTLDDGSKKTSYAFRLVFQATDRTLSDEEVNEIMGRIYKKIADRGWEVR